MTLEITVGIYFLATIFVMLLFYNLTVGYIARRFNKLEHRLFDDKKIEKENKDSK